MLGVLVRAVCPLVAGELGKHRMRRSLCYAWHSGSVAIVAKEDVDGRYVCGLTCDPFHDVVWPPRYFLGLMV